MKLFEIHQESNIVDAVVSKQQKTSNVSRFLRDINELGPVPITKQHYTNWKNNGYINSLEHVKQVGEWLGLDSNDLPRYYERAVDEYIRHNPTYNKTKLQRMMLMGRIKRQMRKKDVLETIGMKPTEHSWYNEFLAGNRNLFHKVRRREDQKQLAGHIIYTMNCTENEFWEAVRQEYPAAVNHKETSPSPSALKPIPQFTGNFQDDLAALRSTMNKHKDND